MDKYPWELKGDEEHEKPYNIWVDGLTIRVSNDRDLYETIALDNLATLDDFIGRLLAARGDLFQKPFKVTVTTEKNDDDDDDDKREMSPEQQATVEAAVNDMRKALHLASAKHKLCALCLVRDFFDYVEDLEERGIAKHGVPPMPKETEEGTTIQ